MWNHFRLFHIWHVCDVENITSYAKFMLLCYKIGFVVSHFCRKICFIQKFPWWRKNDKYEVWVQPACVCLMRL